MLTKLNPITYGVHAVRDATFSRLDATPEALAALNPPLTWWGWEVPLPVQLLVVVGVTVLLLGAAMAQFSRTD